MNILTHFVIFLVNFMASRTDFSLWSGHYDPSPHPSNSEIPPHLGCLLYALPCITQMLLEVTDLAWGAVVVLVTSITP